jgi:hypothetical protein
LVRPFSLSAIIKCRGYSRPLQRAISDFGADESFGNTCKKLKEHYGIDVPQTTSRLIVEKHAKNMRKNQKKISTKRIHINDPKHVIAQLDGGMVPIVTINRKVKSDKRKTRKTGWRESRLSVAHEQGSTTPIYKATLGTMRDAGNQLADVVALSGRGKKTHVHCVGDGAPWIADQVDRVFGSHATYLIDFYHLCQYLAAAANCLAPNDQFVWSGKQQVLMKQNKAETVMNTLKDHIDSEQPKHECGALKCYNYMEKRTHQFDYQGAINNKLPIGSGEVESGHRSVVQKRLKLSGAWWLEKNAENMLAMRTIRANGDWLNYWKPSDYIEMSVN